MSYLDHKMADYDDSCNFDALLNKVPEHLRDGLNRYVWWGIPVGGFLRAILGNDLRKSIVTADSESLAAIRDIVIFIHNALPSNCHGSPEAVRDHIKRGVVFREAHSDNEEGQEHEPESRMRGIR